MYPATPFFPYIMTKVYSSETTNKEKYDHHSLGVRASEKVSVAFVDHRFFGIKKCKPWPESFKYFIYMHEHCSSLKNKTDRRP